MAALGEHDGFDPAHSGILSSPGDPDGWRDLRLTFDVMAAGYLAWLLRSPRTRP